MSLLAHSEEPYNIPSIKEKLLIFQHKRKPCVVLIDTIMSLLTIEIYFSNVIYDREAVTFISSTRPNFWQAFEACSDFVTH